MNVRKTSRVSVRPHILEATEPISVKFDTIIDSILTVFMALQPTTVAFPTSSSLTICVTPIIGILKVKKTLKVSLSTP
jgi:hypothetical protein